MIKLLPREPPLEPAAVVASGPARSTLSVATRRRLDDGAPLRAVGGDQWLVVFGAVRDLPWVDGCRYLGWDGPLLVPTTARPSISPHLAARAFSATGELVILLEDVVLCGPRPVRIADASRLP